MICIILLCAWVIYFYLLHRVPDYGWNVNPGPTSMESFVVVVVEFIWTRIVQFNDKRWAFVLSRCLTIMRRICCSRKVACVT